MGTLRTPDGYVNPEWEDLARKLAQGDGLNWSGDPDLFLGLGVIEELRNGRPTGRTGHRLEVWRYTEQGETVMLASWHPSESWRICYDLAQMRGGVTGRTESLADRLDKADAEMEKKADDAQHDVMMETLSHAAWVHVKKHEPGMKFTEMPGLKDTGPEAAPSLDGVR